MSVGIPIKILHESQGHVIAVELITGDIYRGKLVNSEDNMNIQLSNITHLSTEGRQSEIENVYIRGSKIRLIIMPDMLKNAPMFKRLDPKRPKGEGVGRGKAVLELKKSQR